MRVRAVDIDFVEHIKLDAETGSKLFNLLVGARLYWLAVSTGIGTSLCGTLLIRTLTTKLVAREAEDAQTALAVALIKLN